MLVFVPLSTVPITTNKSHLEIFERRICTPLSVTMAPLSLLDRVCLRVHPDLHPREEALGWSGVFEAACAAEAAGDQGLLRALNKRLSLTQAQHVLRTYVPDTTPHLTTLLSEINGLRAQRGEPPLYLPEGTTHVQAVRCLKALHKTLVCY